ncbi:MAG: IclR family transcriptional regulator [Shimia sp.]
MPNDIDTRVPTNLRLLLMLEALAQAGRPLTPTELNETMGLPKQSIHRLCATLESEGFLSRAGDGRRFEAGDRARRLATGVLEHGAAATVRRTILADISRQTGETVNFVTPMADGMAYLERVETDWPFRIQLPVGSHVPFHCTASGKCFLASLPPRRRATMIAALPLPAKTRATITRPEALAREVAQVAKQGYALDREEFVIDLVACAVPVFDGQGRFQAALATHGPKMRLGDPADIAASGILQEAAARLSKTLYGEA